MVLPCGNFLSALDATMRENEPSCTRTTFWLRAKTFARGERSVISSDVLTCCAQLFSALPRTAVTTSFGATNERSGSPCPCVCVCVCVFDRARVYACVCEQTAHTASKERKLVALSSFCRSALLLIHSSCFSEYGRAESRCQVRQWRTIFLAPRTWWGGRGGWNVEREGFWEERREWRKGEGSGASLAIVHVILLNLTRMMSLTGLRAPLRSSHPFRCALCYSRA